MLEQFVHIVTTLLGVVKFGKYLVHPHEVMSHTEVSCYYNDTLRYLYAKVT